jgi:REP element-mobilizing transposase RayT
MTVAKFLLPLLFLPALIDRRYSLPMADRLRRLEWLFKRNPIYFVTTNTQDRAKILATPAVHKALQSFAESGPDHGVWLGAYVLMPDHVHAFVTLDDRKITLSTWAKSLKNSLSKALRRSAFETPHWQKGFLTTFCGVPSPIQKSGTMSVRIPCEPGWFLVGKIGPTSANLIRSNIGSCRML